MIDLINEKNTLDQKLAKSIQLMEKFGLELAQANHDYNIAKAQTALRLKDEGTQTTMIPIIIKGTGQVPKLALQRDTADVMFRTAMENIQAMKLRMRLIEAQIEREWGQTNGNI